MQQPSCCGIGKIKELLGQPCELPKHPNAASPLPFGPYKDRSGRPVKLHRGVSTCTGSPCRRDSRSRCRLGQQLTRLAMSVALIGGQSKNSKSSRCGSCLPRGNMCCHAAVGILHQCRCSSCSLLLAVRAAYAAAGVTSSWKRVSLKLRYVSCVSCCKSTKKASRTPRLLLPGHSCTLTYWSLKASNRSPWGSSTMCACFHAPLSRFALQTC
jgi:hypothetical protein